MNDAQMQNKRGEWVPAIPLPFYGALGTYRCSCGKWCISELRYKEHYAYTHILMGEATK